MKSRIRKAIIWDTIVATPIPVIPIAGMKLYPNINNGFKNILRRKLKIRTFLNVLVSPSACNKELRATTDINTIDPEKITFVYWRPKLTTSLLEPIIKKISEA